MEKKEERTGRVKEDKKRIGENDNDKENKKVCKERKR